MLELKHIAPYLPYGLKFATHSGKLTTMTYSFNGMHITKKSGHPMHADHVFTVSQNCFLRNYKPLLIPLSEFNESKADEEIFETRKYYTSVMLNEPCDFPYWQFEILLKHHFDVFGLIDKCLALPKGKETTNA